MIFLKVTVLNKEKKSDFSLIYSITLLILGIFLTFNSEGLLNIIFDILGAIVILFGIFQFVSYNKMKQQLQIENTSALMGAVISISIGLLIILLSNFLTNAIQIVTGIWLFFMGISKLNTAMVWKERNQKNFIVSLVGACILILLGIYTIFTQNVVFIFIGIILIIYAIVDLVSYFMRGK